MSWPWDLGGWDNARITFHVIPDALQYEILLRGSGIAKDAFGECGKRSRICMASSKMLQCARDDGVLFLWGNNVTILTVINDAASDVVWLGSNGRATLGSIVGPSVDKKWLALGGWLLGITGTGPKIEAIKAHTHEFPKESAHPFEVLQFLKAAYEKFDIGETEEGLKRYCGSGFLIHKSGAIWDFDNSFCLTEVPRGAYWARGSGMDLAIGAAAGLKPYVSSTKELTRRALEITIAMDVDCPGEVLVQTFDREGVLSDPIT